ncbi:MAG: hypothetical protein K940chlam1_00312 [Candidatus Anoxychlamydiales bacterium]|nr:hypothetical protein [Candidatus Anoxychlamydiales bacterium]NGX36206.1 hypothetical protein [Candidatus Anoxychlamydiales bacterium]
MRILVYIIEWIVSFLIIWGLNFSLNNIYQKKISPIAASIFTFITIGFIAFFVSPYIYSFPHPFLIYLPIAIFFFIITVLKIVKPSP